MGIVNLCKAAVTPIILLTEPRLLLSYLISYERLSDWFLFCRCLLQQLPKILV